LRFEGLYRGFELDDSDLVPFLALSPLRVVAVGEDWCPDVYNTLPIIAKVADRLPGMEMRIFERDTREDVMNDYLSNGKKRIPVFAFFDAGFHSFGWWAGRNAEAEQWVVAFQRGRTYEEIPEDEMGLFREEFDRRYRESWARLNFEEITAMLIGKCGEPGTSS
jgi:thiol-disulfide isomerase/thioredoxin